jgi:signal transduction histidine kinase
VYRIAGEAIRNAFCHSGAARIEADISYGKRQFRLRIRDNGKGMDPNVLKKGWADWPTKDSAFEPKATVLL